MTIYYARTIGNDNTRPRKLTASTLADAKHEAVALYGEGFLDDVILIERENESGVPVIIAGKTNREAKWDNLSLAVED